MSDLKQAAEKALEVLESLQGGCTDSADGTVEAITVWCPEEIESLRAALAEPSREPVAWRPLLTFRPKHLPPSDFTAGVPDEKTVTYWANQGVEIEYAYAAPTAPVVPPKISASDADYWLKNRAAILQAIADQGFTLVSNAAGFRLMKLGKIEAQAAPVVRDGDTLARIAGLEASIANLSRLVDEQRALLSEVNEVCGRDGHGAELEDGESELIDKVRAHLDMIAAPHAAPVVPDGWRLVPVEPTPEMLHALADNVSLMDFERGAMVGYAAALAAAPTPSQTGEQR